jgi:hypothetical protein
MKLKPVLMFFALAHRLKMVACISLAKPVPVAAIGVMPAPR